MVNFVNWRASQPHVMPVGVAVIGCSSLALAFLAMARNLTWLRVLAISDPDIESTRQRVCARFGWDAERLQAESVLAALATDSIFLTANAADAISQTGIEIVLEATGDVSAAVHTALTAYWAKRSIIMATQSADVLLGPMLSRWARKASVIYSLDFGSAAVQVSEMFERVRLCGLSVICAGRTDVSCLQWRHSTREEAAQLLGFGDAMVEYHTPNAYHYTAIVDGTSLAHDMASMANVCGLDVHEDGLAFPNCPVDELPLWLEQNRRLPNEGQNGFVEAVSRAADPGSGFGIHGDTCFVVVHSLDSVTAGGLAELSTRPIGQQLFSTYYRTVSLPGALVPLSIASIAWRKEPTAQPTQFRADVSAVAKRDLVKGEGLGGIGSDDVYGTLCSARQSLEENRLPIGVSSLVRMRFPVPQDQPIRWSDVEFDHADPVISMRLTMEDAYRRVLVDGEQWLDYTVLDRSD